MGNRNSSLQPGSLITGYGTTLATGTSATQPNAGLEVAGKSAALSLAAQTNPINSQDSSKVNQDNGRPFVEMIQAIDVYGTIACVKGSLEIYISKIDLHWLLLVKLEGGAKLPFLSIEITTSDKTNIIPTMRLISEEPDNKWRELISQPETTSLVGTYTGKTLLDLCSMADEVVDHMKTYNLFTSNCQHFCNNLLKRMGLRTFLTTIGPNITEGKNDRFDYISNVMQQIRKAAGSDNPPSADQTTTTIPAGTKTIN